MIPLSNGVHMIMALNVTLNLIFNPKVAHRLQQRRFRHISASAVRASEKVQLLRIGSRLRAFQRAIDEVRTLPLTPPKGGSKSEFIV